MDVYIIMRLFVKSSEDYSKKISHFYRNCNTLIKSLYFWHEGKGEYDNVAHIFEDEFEKVFYNQITNSTIFIDKKLRHIFKNSIRKKNSLKTRQQLKNGVKEFFGDINRGLFNDFYIDSIDIEKELNLVFCPDITSEISKYII